MLDQPLRDQSESGLTQAPDPTSGQVDGYIEICGPLDGGGWLIGGWARQRWREQTSNAVTLRLSSRAITGRATACFFDRGDLQRGSTGDDPAGFLMLLQGDAAAEGTLVEVLVRLPGTILRLLPAVQALPSPGHQMREATQRLAAEVGAPQARAFLAILVDPQPLTERDTLAELGRPVRVVVESANVTASGGLVLLGWLDDPQQIIAGLYLRWGQKVMKLDETTWLRLPRQDVDQGLDSSASGPDRGFVAYLPDLCPPPSPAPRPLPCLAMAFTDGVVACQTIASPAIAYGSAVRRVLSAIHLHPAALSRAMDAVLGPMVAALDASARADRRPDVLDLCFGPTPTPARCSVIVPLAGPPDALEWQLALLSQAPHTGVEFIYILDEPSLSGAVERRAQTCHARFGLPFRLVLLDRRVGRARCCNIAAALATGRFLCFLGGSALPDRPDWLERLLDTLEQTPTLGAVGATTGPGDRNDPLPAVAEVGIACLALPRDLFMDLDGFDEACAIGGIEDEDLCRRLRGSGLHCALRRDVTVTLLDRAPEATEPWRQHLAVYADWQRRGWAAAEKSHR